MLDMYLSKGRATQKNEKIRMLALFNTLTEEDKDLVISMSDSLVRKYGIFLKVKMHKTGQKKEGGK
jgi:hypothetical protein